MARRAVTNDNLGKAIDRQFLGHEPLFNGDAPQHVVASAYMWYQKYAEYDDYKRYFLDTPPIKLTSTQRTLISKADPKLFGTLGPLARMISRGLVLNDQRLEFIRSRIEAVCSKVVEATPSIVKSEPVERISIQEHIREKAQDLIGDLEVVIDEFVANDYRTKFDFDAWVKTNDVKRPILDRISKHYAKLKQELERVVLGDKEGYENVGKREVKRYLDLINTFVHTSKALSDEAKSKRKKRKKRKEKPIEQQVAGIKCLENDKALGITSIDPRKIVGASAVVLYNPSKYTPFLTVLIADAPSGLTVKRSKIGGWSKTQSISARVSIRKFEQVKDKLLSGTVRTLKNVVDDVAGSRQPIKDRTTDSTLIVSVVR